MDITGIRAEVVKSVVGAMATIILGVVVAGVSGIFQKIDAISDIKREQSVQGAQIGDLKEKMDKRKEDSTDSRVALSAIAEQHRYLMDELRTLRAELAAARKSH